MKIDELNHSLTPSALQQINEKIAALLSSEEDDDRVSKLNQLATDRDSFIQAYLKSLPPEEAKQFAKQEIVVNDKLKEITQLMLTAVKDDITHFVRSRSAVKKYKK
ncbi:hypothetical protein OPS25_03630 [Alteromonas ponticola]|uniref:Flagellar protein FliT n=1 Tax=Alteromonas aquimaris TaxID=2998417 RepID=A0ABT3P514_9ALTE|nr:hypothetical protein [Alteromonas aquimaris]MCW8107595.1 hypothetical protein [Alteromonas aquimaris]